MPTVRDGVGFRGKPEVIEGKPNRRD